MPRRISCGDLSEEEATLLAIVEKLRKAGEAGTLVMDAQLHTR